MTLPKIISYYTSGDKNNYYVKCANELINQCKQYNYDYYIENIPSLNDYKKNCKLKPKFILDCLSKFNQPLLFLDVDAVLAGCVPDSFSHFNNYDIGLTLVWGDPIENELENYKIIGNSKSLHGNYLNFRDGFIYANNTTNCINFMKEWDVMCKTTQYHDHLSLDHLAKQHMRMQSSKVLILSNKVNITEGCEGLPEGKRAFKKDLVENKQVFCYYRISR